MCGYTADPEDGRTCFLDACFCCFGFHFFSTKPRNWLEERLQNDLFCVTWDVKPQLSQNYWATEWHLEIFTRTVQKIWYACCKNVTACTVSQKPGKNYFHDNYCHVMCEADSVICSHTISQQILKIVEEFVIVVSRFLDCVYIRL